MESVIPSVSYKPQRRMVSRRSTFIKKIENKTFHDLNLNAIIDAIQEPVIILDKDLRMQSINTAFIKTFKATKKSMLGRQLFQNRHIPPRAKELIIKLKKLSKYNTSIKEFELSLYFNIVGERTLLINAKRISSQNKDFEFILLSIADITQRKLVERQKDDFVGYVTHELKTPITSLSAFLQLLQGYHTKTGDRKSQFLLAKAAGQLENLTKLLNSFTHVYKAQTGMLDLQKEKFDLYELVRETVEMFQYTTTTHTISIDGALSKPIVADKERIKQVIVNLLINAIKYSPDADTIIVKMQEEKKHIVISVRDFGPGIPKEAQTSIFERFFRIKENQVSHVKGLGLGLYIALEIIKEHKGKLWVDSTEGRGSTFSFSVPIK